MRIVEIWRYPVASMGGERLQTAVADRSGLIGDRAFSVICRETGEVADPEGSAKWRTAPLVAARGFGLDLEIRTPKTDWLPAFGRTAGKALDEHFGFEVALTRTGIWGDPVTNAGRARPRDRRAPLNLVSRRMLDAIEDAVPGAAVSAPWLRANLVVDLGDRDERTALRAGLVQSFGETLIRLGGPTRRGAFVALVRAEASTSPQALRVIRREHGLSFGHDADVVRAGRLVSSPDPAAWSSQPLRPETGARTDILPRTSPPYRRPATAPVPSSGFSP